jgi:myo-inositol-1(or 4)-monophosphatase
MTLTDAEVALAAAEAGAAVIRARFGTTLIRHTKSRTDFATDVDLDAEAAIREVLTRHRPEDAQLGEEGGASGSAQSPRRWLVDPLCGTLNFAAELPLVATNVALAIDGRVVAAAMAAPLTDEVFWSDNEQAHVRRAGIDARLVQTAVTRMVDVNLDGNLELRRRAVELLAHPDFHHRFEPRVVSTTLALGWVAAGRHAAYVTEGDLRDNVHFAAGIGVCQAAGCVVTDLDGVTPGSGDASSRGGLIAAADADTSRALVRILGGRMSGTAEPDSLSVEAPTRLNG